METMGSILGICVLVGLCFSPYFVARARKHTHTAAIGVLCLVSLATCWFIVGIFTWLAALVWSVMGFAAAPTPAATAGVNIQIVNQPSGTQAITQHEVEPVVSKAAGVFCPACGLEHFDGQRRCERCRSNMRG